MRFSFKKSLGQHFLRDKETLNKIVFLREIKDQIIVEIGPGDGALTKVILNRNPKRLIVIEKDESLREYLETIKKKYPNKLRIIYDDALNINFQKIDENKLTLIANLPYNIASTLLIELIHSFSHFKRIIVMVQKEVAERLSAKVSTKSYGRISVLMQLHSDIRKCFDVSPEKFRPQPNVFSSVIEIIPKKKDKFDFHNLDKVLKISFGKRRKTIKNNLKEIENFSEKQILNFGIQPASRPQDLTPENYVKLSNYLFK